jgi:hypothetical protein
LYSKTLYYHPIKMAQPTSSEPNLLQAMLTASRQERAKAEEMIAASEVEKRIEAAKEEWITQARAEMETIMSQANMYVLPSPWCHGLVQHGQGTTLPRP